MVVVRSTIPKRPFYISESIEVNWKWAGAFNTGLQALGTKYGISEADKDKVAAATHWSLMP